MIGEIATLAGLVVVFLIVVGVIVINDISYRRDDLAAEPDRSTSAEHHRAQEWVAVWMHAARPHTPTVEEARRDMQLHCECRRWDCPRKDAAFELLVVEGILRPSQRRAIVR